MLANIFGPSEESDSLCLFFPRHTVLILSLVHQADVIQTFVLGEADEGDLLTIAAFHFVKLQARDLIRLSDALNQDFAVADVRCEARVAVIDLLSFKLQRSVVDLELFALV